MRTFVIGDIHGGLKALMQLTDRLQCKSKDHLIFLGDYVDGWSESAQVIQYMIELSRSHICTFVRGNHDVWCEEWLRDDILDETWLEHGGNATIASYDGISKEERLRHVIFFEKMSPYYLDEKNRLFIHAGFTSMHGVEKEKHIDNFYEDRTLWEMALTMDAKIEKNSNLYPNRLKHYEEVYIGHTPTILYGSLVPMNAINVWNVDTGAAFDGHLSAMDIETKEIFQSDVVRTLYPNEKGRN